MQIKPIFALLIISLLANWASQPKTRGARFFGTLTTEQGNTFTVKNITAGPDKKIEAIPVYEKPQKPDAFVKRDENHITLNVDPKKELAIIYLDLDKIMQVSVPHPHSVWTYKAEKGSREYEYLEIAITEKSKPSQSEPTSPQPPSPTTYLIEKNIHLYCDRVGDGITEKMKVQLPAIKQLIIEGYIHESTSEQDSCPKNPVVECNKPQPTPKTPTIELTPSPQTSPAAALEHGFRQKASSDTTKLCYQSLHPTTTDNAMTTPSKKTKHKKRSGTIRL